MPSLVAPDNTFAVLASLFCIVLLGLMAERTELGRKLTAPLIALTVGMLVANLRVLPFESPAYGFVVSYLVPLAIPLLLLNANLKKIFKETGPTLIAFLGGAVGTILGATGGFLFLDVGPETYKIVGVLAASFIGGSFNFVAVSQALEIQDSALVAAAAAAQGVVAIGYLSFLIAAPSIPFLQRMFRRTRGPVKASQAGPASRGDDLFGGDGPTSTEVPACIAFSLVVCSVGYGVAALFGTPQFAILFITLITVAVASFAPGLTRLMRGGASIGLLLVYVFIAAVGAQSNVWLLAGTAPALVGFLAVLLAVHATATALVGRLFGLTLPEILVGSNACALGATTAAAVAAGKRWHDLVTPGILSGMLGYVIANFIGVALSYWLAG